jgi:predicted flavoprotein YhiN
MDELKKFQKQTLNEKLTEIQVKFKSKKSRYNSFGRYYFRSSEDILEALKPYLNNLKVSVIINERLCSYEATSPVIESTATISDGVNQISAKAIVGIGLDQKGMQMPQKYGAASSYGKKYALGNLFLIDDTLDADQINKHNKQ